MEMIDKTIEIENEEGLIAGYQAVSSAVSEDYVIFTLEKTWGSLQAKVSGYGEMTSGATFVPPVACEIKVYFKRHEEVTSEPPEDAIGYDELVNILRRQAQLHKAMLEVSKEF